MSNETVDAIREGAKALDLDSRIEVSYYGNGIFIVAVDGRSLHGPKGRKSFFKSRLAARKAGEVAVRDKDARRCFLEALVALDRMPPGYTVAVSGSCVYLERDGNTIEHTDSERIRGVDW